MFADSRENGYCAMKNGIINVYKERGFTSFDVVAKLRGILHEKKIGHTGTLDPDATGVLPVCVGSATKVCALLTDKDKVYEAVMHLGLTTDTLDASGTVLEDCSSAAAELSVSVSAVSDTAEVSVSSASTIFSVMMALSIMILLIRSSIRDCSTLNLS